MWTKESTGRMIGENALTDFPVFEHDGSGGGHVSLVRQWPRVRSKCLLYLKNKQVRFVSAKVARSLSRWVRVWMGVGSRLGRQGVWVGVPHNDYDDDDNDKMTSFCFNLFLNGSRTFFLKTRPIVRTAPAVLFSKSSGISAI